MTDQEKKDQEAKAAADKTAADAKMAAEMDAEIVKMKQAEAEKVNFAEMQVQFQAMKVELSEATEKIKMQDDEKFIDDFFQNGKTTPAMKDPELALYHSLDDEQRVLFNAYKDAAPTLVDFKIFNRQEVKKPGAAPTKAENEKEADEIVKCNQGEAVEAI